MNAVISFSCIFKEISFNASEKYHKYRFVFCLFYYALEIFFAIKEDNVLIPITSISNITAVA